MNDILIHYRPQRSWGKVIFSEACVKNSVHRGGCLGRPPRADTPRNRHPPKQCMLGDMGNKRAARILLECILVKTKCPSKMVTDNSCVINPRLTCLNAFVICVLCGYYASHGKAFLSSCASQSRRDCQL